MRKQILVPIFSLLCIIVLFITSTENVYAAKTCAVSGCENSCATGSNYCRQHTCQKDGCSGLRKDNGTVYCDTHAKHYAEEQGYKPCAASGCYRRRATGSSYCSTHTCKQSGCTKQVVTGSNYCITHKPKPVQKSTKSYTKSTNKKTYKKNNYDSYDVNEYDDPDDFADEWGEEFGDGSFDDGYDDAYDYWEDEHDGGYDDDWN